ncbi:ABC transporter ATP-binding protein [Propionibacteriaceae bacterium G1746]|uniref:ABC transporter ATP-binding protein n=1 Tax=Aestuariimicrobium sp. G57 TaxID=3418485 RepID=UPI003C20AB9D
MTSVSLHQISKTYPGSSRTTVAVDLAVAEGEFFTLLGPSGCGKSTLLRMIAGFLAPTRGRILFGDKDVTNLPPHKRGIGMVFQNYALFPHMTVAENVGYGLRLRNVDKPDRHRRIDKALKTVDLTGYGDRRIDQLSGGQQQRVALARAIVIEPTVLLLDEPLSNLDAKLREETRAEIRATQRGAGATAVYVTHDQAEAMSMSDRIAVLADGRAHQVGSPKQVYAQPATPYVARFIGRSNVVPMTVAHVGDDHAVVTLAGTSIGARRHPDHALQTGQAVNVSLRPEALALVGETEGQFAGVVKAVEYLGASALARVDVGGVDMMVSTPRLDVAVDESVHVVTLPRAGWVIPE